MTSLWQRLGQGVGYALAAVILGPPAAIARRERRALRSAFKEWCEELGAVRLEARGVMSRAGNLPASAGSLPFSVVLDAFAKRAVLDVATGTLPPNARATIMKDAAGIRVTSDTLDLSATDALARDVAQTGLARLESFVIDIDGERVVLQINAPTTHAEWRAIGLATAQFTEAVVRTWEKSYR